MMSEPKQQEQNPETIDFGAIAKRIQSITEKTREAKKQLMNSGKCEIELCRKGSGFGTMRYNGTFVECPLKTHECEAGRAESRYIERQITEILFNQGVPRDNVKADLQNCLETPYTKSGREYIRVSSPEFRKSFMLLARTGRGKSFATAGILREFLRSQIKKAEDIEKAIRPVFISSRDIIAEYKDNYEGRQILNHRLRVCRLLVIDDLATGADLHDELKIVIPIALDRANNYLGTLLTTQLSGEEVQSRYGERFASRITAPDYLGAYYFDKEEKDPDLRAQRD